jgi:hypothetical protein
MIIDTNPIADGNAAMTNAAANTSTPPPATTTPAPSNNLMSGTNGLPGEGGSVAPSAKTGLLDESGKFAEGWLDKLEGFDDSKQILGQFRDINGLLKTVVSQQRLLGKKADAVLVPSDKATPEERQEFLRKLGVPDTADPYKAIKPQTLPEASEWNDQVAQKLGEIAHQNGITPKQWQSLLDTFGELERQGVEMQQAAEQKQLEDARKSLAEEWGDRFDTNMSKAKRLVQLGGGDFNDPGLTSPGMVKLLARIAETISDDKLVSADSSATMMVGRARAFDIMKNPQNPLHTRYTSGDREIADLVTDLLKQS